MVWWRGQSDEPRDGVLNCCGRVTEWETTVRSLLWMENIRHGSAIGLFEIGLLLIAASRSHAHTVSQPSIQFTVYVVDSDIDVPGTKLSKAVCAINFSSIEILNFYNQVISP